MSTALCPGSTSQASTGTPTARNRRPKVRSDKKVVKSSARIRAGLGVPIELYAGLKQAEIGAVRRFNVNAADTQALSSSVVTPRPRRRNRQPIKDSS